MKKEYPRIGTIIKIKKKGLCKICGLNKCDRVVEIEFNYFRGDDEIYPVHQDCILDKPKEKIINILLKKDPV